MIPFHVKTCQIDDVESETSLLTANSKRQTQHEIVETVTYFLIFSNIAITLHSSLCFVCETITETFSFPSLLTLIFISSFLTKNDVPSVCIGGCCPESNFSVVRF